MHQDLLLSPHAHLLHLHRLLVEEWKSLLEAVAYVCAGTQRVCICLRLVGWSYKWCMNNITGNMYIDTHIVPTNDIHIAILCIRYDADMMQIFTHLYANNMGSI